MSSRAANIFIEKLMYDQWKQGVKALRVMNLPEATMSGELKALASFINASTGRSKLPTEFVAGKIGPFLNALFFSPRLIWSRLSLPTKLFSPHRLVRQEATRAAVSLMATGSGLLGLYALATRQVPELDPRHADWGKMKFGDTRVDIWGGYLQYARFISRLLTGSTKTSLGDVRPMNRAEVLRQFLLSKEAPGPGLINDLISGETREGKPVTFGGEVVNQFLPLIIADFVEAAHANGVIPGAVFSSMAGVGIGVQTYPAPTAVESIKMKAAVYRDLVTKANQHNRRSQQKDQVDLMKKNPGAGWAMDAKGQVYSKTYRFLAGIEQDLAKYTRALDTVAHSPKYTPEQRRELTKRINEIMETLAAEAWMQYQAIEGKALITGQE